MNLKSFNQLVGRAHTSIYQGEPLCWKQPVRFDRCMFPQLYRALLPYPLTAFVLFWMPAIAAFWAVSPDQKWIYVMASVGLIAGTLLHLYWSGVCRHATERSPDENTLL